VPKHKHEGRPNINAQEVQEMLDACVKVSDPLRLQCIVGLSWLFGKRINETLKLKLKDVSVKGKYLYVSFLVSKQKDKKPFTKKVSLKHFCVPYVLQYLSRRLKESATLCEAGKVKDIGNEYLFPSYGKPYTIKTKHYFKLDERGKLQKLKHGEKDKATECRTYTYQVEGGHISPNRVRQLFSEVTTAWPHLFRASLATEFIERPKINIYDLLNFFDWQKTDTAIKYIRHSAESSSKFSNRTK
jgi:integrase